MDSANEIRVRQEGPVAGTYYIDSMYDKECIAVTAQGLLDLAEWIAANRAQLETEAQDCNMVSLDARLGRGLL